MTTTNNIKPILFSTEMVQAILAGRKTQTRRICKYQRNNDGKYEVELNGKIVSELDFNIEYGVKNPFIKEKKEIGDILWVRETWSPGPLENGIKTPFIYKADGDKITKIGDTSFRTKWKPSIFMPKEACRILLKVTNVRCERLQDISSSDAMAEGILIERQSMANGEGWFYPKNYATNGFFKIGQYRESFQTLWDSINEKKYPWKSNPWVWVYDFEVTEKPENFLP